VVGSINKVTKVCLKEDNQVENNTENHTINDTPLLVKTLSFTGLYRHAWLRANSMGA
jgi:hypothetical protein